MSEQPRIRDLYRDHVAGKLSWDDLMRHVDQYLDDYAARWKPVDDPREEELKRSRLRSTVKPDR